MRSGFACRLAAAAIKRSDITVFPGVEITCAGGQLGNSAIHVLGIFPPDATEHTIERIYSARHGSVPSPAERTGKEVLHVESLSSLADAVRREGGLFLLAHIDEDKRGHRSRFRVSRHRTLARHESPKDSQDYKEIEQQVADEYFVYLAELAPDAIEIMNPQARVHYASFTLPDGQQHGIACVARSDHHSVEDLSRDEAITYLKVSRTDLRCVRDALTFHETRIRFKDDRPSTPSPRLVGIQLRCTTGKGLFADATIAFNANLNCIIGPRGSGKSTVIEAMRYALVQNSALRELSAGSSEQVHFAGIAQGIQRANLADTLIEVVYETNGDRFVLSTTYDQEAAETTTVHRLDGSQRPVAPSVIPSEFPVRLYSWSEIETLGRKPELQRALLDRLIPDLRPLLDQREEVTLQMGANRGEIDLQCQALEQLANSHEGLLGRYTQYKNDFEQINTEEVADMFATLDTARERLAALKQVEVRLESLQDALEKQGLDYTGPEAPIEAIAAWWSNDVEPVVDLRGLHQELQRLGELARREVGRRLTSLRALIASQEDESHAAEQALREATRTAPEDEIRRDQREERKKRFDLAAEQRRLYQEALARLRQLLADRSGLANRLEELQRAILSEREASREMILDRLDEAQTGLAISLDLEGLADRADAVDYLENCGLLTREAFGHYREKRVAERTLRTARPTNIVRAVIAKDSSGFGDNQSLPVGQEGALSKGEVDDFVRQFHPFSEEPGAEVTLVDRTRLLVLLELEERPIEDRMRILLDGQPVDQRSPGQRSSAMLPLVALSETVPLVIDQPEDNLDNRMVGRTLTRILAALKDQRQIIVTTHNPNIVVGGDAEQVIELIPSDTDPHAARLGVTGSIDDDQVVHTVIAVMEGGREAFEARTKRYALAELVSDAVPDK